MRIAREKSSRRKTYLMTRVSRDSVEYRDGPPYAAPRL